MPILFDSSVFNGQLKAVVLQVWSPLAAGASPGNLLQMQIHQQQPNPRESEAWGQGPQVEF